jgi:ribosomal protein L24E
MKCSYCLKEIEKGTGFAFVNRNGTTRYYCTNRCKKLNLDYNRKLRIRENKPTAATKT